MKPVRLLLLAFTLAASSPALAAPILTFAFQGVVTELTANAGLFGMPGTVNVGDPFSGQFSYDRGPGNPDQVPADAELGGYDLLSFTIDQSVLPLTPFAAVVRHIPPILTLPPLPPDPGTDAFSVRSAPLSGYPNGVSLRLEAPFGAVFSDDSLPADLSLASFTLSAGVYGIVALGIFPTPSIWDVGQLTSLVRVPEPGLLPLFVFAAALAAAVRPARR